MLAETGLVGFVLGIGFLISSWATVLHHKRGRARKGLLLVLPAWLYCFAIAMVSQDIPANIEVLYFPIAAVMGMKIYDSFQGARQLQYKPMCRSTMR